MTERTLFDTDPPDKLPPTLPPRLPHNGTITSKLTAQSMRCHATAQQQRVLEALQAAGEAGMTDEEIQATLNLGGNSERPRRRKLVELGFVKDSGVMRKTGSNHAAVVWIAVPPSERPTVASKANWPTDDKTNPNKADAAEFVLDFAI